MEIISLILRGPLIITPLDIYSIAFKIGHISNEVIPVEKDKRCPTLWIGWVEKFQCVVNMDSASMQPNIAIKCIVLKHNVRSVNI